MSPHLSIVTLLIFYKRVKKSSPLTSNNTANHNIVLYCIVLYFYHVLLMFRQAVSWIDNYTLITGRLLRSYSLLRLGFVLYLLILHIWVFVVIAFHTHSLEDFDASSNMKPKLLPGMESNTNKLD